MLYKQAVLWGISNKDTRDQAYRPRGIEVKRIEDDENSWEDTEPGMDAKTAWSGIYYDPQPNITYQYRAFVTAGPNENRERVYGDVKTFTYNNFLDTYRFAFSANPPEGGTVTGYIDDEAVTNPILVSEDVNNPSSWKVEQTPKEGYEFNHFTIYDEGTSSSFEDTVEGLMTSNVNVIAFYDEIESGGGEDPVLSNVVVYVIVNNIFNDPRPYTSYINLNNPGFPVQVGNEWNFDPIPKTGYEITGWSLNTVDKNENWNDFTGHINFQIDGNPTYLYIWVAESNTFHVWARSNPAYAANMSIIGPNNEYDNATGPVVHKEFPIGQLTPIQVQYSLIDPDYQFKNWTEDNNVTGVESNTYTYTIQPNPSNSSVTIVANFEAAPDPEEITITIKCDPSNGGLIKDANDSTNYAAQFSPPGKTVISPWVLEKDLYATPNPGFGFKRWTMNGANATPGNSPILLRENVNSVSFNTTLIAEFEKNKCTINFETDQPSISIQPSSATVDYNTKLYDTSSFSTNLIGSGAEQWEIDSWVENNNPIDFPIEITDTRTFTAKLVARPTVDFRYATDDWTDDPWKPVYITVNECKQHEFNCDQYGIYNDPLWEYQDASDVPNNPLNLVYIPGLYARIGSAKKLAKTYVRVPLGFEIAGIYDFSNGAWTPCTAEWFTYYDSDSSYDIYEMQSTSNTVTGVYGLQINEIE